ncbi:MAG: CvpA family protein [Caulobacter sp.]|nr:CvpA family protein [Caulobacter sp.]
MLTQFDFIAGPLLIVSALVGYSRGATKELMTVLALVLAAIIAVFFLRFTADAGRALIDPDWAGVGVALLFVFGVAYVGLRMLGSGLERRVQETQGVGTLDRAVGSGFGLVRALVILGGFSLLFNMAAPPDKAPTWVTRGLFYPLTEASGRVLKAFGPDGLAVAQTVAPKLEAAVRAGAGTAPAPEKGYDAGERSAVDDLVEKTR